LVKSLVQKSHLAHTWTYKTAIEARKRPFSGTTELVANLAAYLA
jgi:hypothetical protein